MSNAQHTPEPWGNGSHKIVVVNGAARTRITGDHAGDRLIQMTETDYRHAVACVNACAGRTNDELQSLIDFGGVSQLVLAYDGEMIRATVLEAQRDQLLDLLTIALPYIEDAEKDPVYKQGVVAKLTKQMRAAIVAAGGANV